MKKMARTAAALAVCAAAALAALVYAVKIEPFTIRVRRVGIEAGFSEGLKIVQISDLHVSRRFHGEDVERVVEAVNEQEADLVLFTGDLYDNYAEYHCDEELAGQLSRIQASYGKYAVWGNRDYGGGAAGHYQKVMEDGGFRLLRNESETIAAGGKTLRIAGADDGLLGRPAQIRERAEGDWDFSLLMVHEPDLADWYGGNGFDLIAAGHSHGGQAVLPFFPGITTAMAEQYRRGMYQLESGSRLYVNSGIGTARVPIRFMTPPEVTVFMLGG